MLEAKFIPRAIGVEVETVCPYMGLGGNSEVQQSVARLLSANGVSAVARPYNHASVETDMAVETDASLSFAECPYNSVNVASLEVKSRILRDLTDFQTIVPKTLEILQFCGCRVNATTGFHVHASIPEIRGNPRVIRSLYNLIHKYQFVLYGLTAQSRVSSRYCPPLPLPPTGLRHARTMRSFKSALREYDRYHIVNWQHIGEEVPRVEFRLWAGTLNPTKALNYVRICCGLIDHAVRRSVQAVPSSLPNDRKSLESLMVCAGFKVNSGIYSVVSDDMRETGRWMLRRWGEINGRQALKPKNGAVSGAVPSVCIED